MSDLVAKSNKAGEARRVEKCHIKLELDKVAYDRRRRDVNVLVNGLRYQLAERDTLHVDFDFDIYYFGDIAEKLAALKRIAGDTDIVISADCKLLEECQCLIYESLRNLEAAVETIKTRQALSEQSAEMRSVNSLWSRIIRRIRQPLI